MKKVGTYQARTRLSHLLDKVSRGEKIAITRHGVTIALLVPPHESMGRDIATVIEELRELRREVKLGGLSIRDMIDQGRKY